MAQQIKERVLAGRYRVLERLGSGGMAAVYLAEDERLGRRVAVKRLHADSPEDMARRFQREAKLLASLNHPNVVSVFDTVTDPEGVLIVMEYVDGETLSQALTRGPLEPRRAAEVIGAVAAALDHAHQHGVVHRDVKPANVLCGRGVVKLADLGIATAAEGTQITRTGTVLGTPAYMAPEQIEGKPLTSAVDVYSLATVAFEALAGRKAREGRTPMEIAHRVATEPAPDLRDAWPKAPRAAADVLRRGMARDPRRRPASAGELAAELSHALVEGATAATAPLPAADRTAPLPPGAPAARRPPAPPPATGRGAPARARRRRRGVAAWLPLAALVAVVVAIVAFAAADGGDQDPGGEEAALPSQGEEPRGDREQPPASEQEEQPPAQQEQPDGDPVARGIELNDQGFVLMNEDRFDEAIPPLQESVGLLEGSGRIEYQYALFNLGSALRQAGRPEEAIPILEPRLQYPDQRDTVQRELDLAREAAGDGGRGEGRGGGRGRGKKGDGGEDD